MGSRRPAAPLPVERLHLASKIPSPETRPSLRRCKKKKTTYGAAERRPRLIDSNAKTRVRSDGRTNRRDGTGWDGMEERCRTAVLSVTKSAVNTSRLNSLVKELREFAVVTSFRRSDGNSPHRKTCTGEMMKGTARTPHV